MKGRPVNINKFRPLEIRIETREEFHLLTLISDLQLGDWRKVFTPERAERVNKIMEDLHNILKEHPKDMG